jgi:hypothetical protein
MKRVKQYEYSNRQYRLEIVLPGNKRKYIASYRHRKNAEAVAYRLSRCTAVRATITRRCDSRIVWDSHGMKYKAYAPLCPSECAA